MTSLISFPAWLRSRKPDGILPTVPGYADLVGDLAFAVAEEIRSGGIRRCPRTASALRTHLLRHGADGIWLDAADLAAIEYVEHLVEHGHPAPALDHLSAEWLSTEIANIVRDDGTGGMLHISPRLLFVAGHRRGLMGWPHTFEGFCERYRRTGWDADGRARAFPDAPIFMIDDRDEVAA